MTKLWTVLSLKLGNSKSESHPFLDKLTCYRLKNEVVYHSRKEREDELNFERIKQKMIVDGKDHKGAYLKNFNNEYLDIDVGLLQLTEAVTFDHFNPNTALLTFLVHQGIGLQLYSQEEAL